METDQNVPAFPIQDCSKWQYHGMSLRDYFAAKAMQGCYADPNVNGTQEQVAKWAYDVADAMLAERAKRGATDDRI